MLAVVPLGGPIRTTLGLHDDLLAAAQRLTGTTEKTALARQALGA